MGVSGIGRPQYVLARPGPVDPGGVPALEEDEPRVTSTSLARLYGERTLWDTLRLSARKTVMVLPRAAADCRGFDATCRIVSA